MSPTPATLFIGLLVAAPALWAAFRGTLPVDVALQRLVIILLVISIGGSILRTLVQAYSRAAAAAALERGTGVPDRRAAPRRDTDPGTS
jgi:O-antigen/teichoic acid export membrane protein